MKTCIGLFMLVMLLVAASGCTTQQTTPAATATTLTTTAAATEVPTAIPTPLPATTPKKVSTTAAVPEITANVTTMATPQPSRTASTAITTIHIRNNTFVPAELTVLPGTGITWINDDSVTHIVKATGNATGKFTSTEMVNGAHFGYTFGEATGTYEFMDPKYPEMKGAIIVRKGESLWSASNTP